MKPRRTSRLFAATAIVLMCAATASAQQESDIPFYVGRDACLDCHLQGKSWLTCLLEPIPEHDTTYELLSKPEALEIAAMCGVADVPQQSRICLGCHAAGADAGPRWWCDTFDVAQGVQCEACHGPGSLHIETADSPAARAALRPVQNVHRVNPGNCLACHVDRPSHQAVVEMGFKRMPADSAYKTPINLVVSPDGARLYVVCEHSGSVIAIDTQTRGIIGEATVGRRPHDVALSPDGATLYITNRVDDTLSVLNAATLTITATIAVGDEPHGVLTDATGAFIYVLNTGDNTISVLDAKTLAESKRLVAGQGPWSLAMSPDGARLAVTSVRPNPARFREGSASEITLIDTQTQTIASRTMANDANMLEGIAYVPHRNIALFVLMRTKNLVPMTQLMRGWTITNGLGILRPDGRVDQVLLDAPNAAFPDAIDVAVAPDGRHALVTSGGANEIGVVDIDALLATIDAASDADRRDVLPNHLGKSDTFLIRRVRVGRNPRGLAFSPDGSVAYVANALDDTISVIAASNWEIADSIDLGGPKQTTELRWGEQLFHDASHTFARQLSCRSCHPDGHVNGLDFDIEPDGIGRRPVDNRTLRGIVDTGPFKWEGTNPSLQYQCGPRLAVFFTRAEPFTPAELDALVQYECTIERPPNRYRQPDGLTLAQMRGKLVFERAIDNRGKSIPERLRCSTCHYGSYMTNRMNENVGTAMWFDAPADFKPEDVFDASSYGRLGISYFTQERTYLEIDVPHLNNIYDGGPYLHNGAAQTLEQIWTDFNLYDYHGYTQDMTRQQFNDLIAYMKAM